MSKEIYEILINYAFRILAKKSYTKAEMEKKLRVRAAKVEKKSLKESVSSNAEASMKKIMQRLHELNYLNDERILSNYFEYRLKNRPQGKFAFIHEMRRRGISADIAQKQWEERGIDELALAQELIDKKFKKFRDKNTPLVLLKKKIAVFLAGRGFSSEIIWEALSNVL